MALWWPDRSMLCHLQMMLRALNGSNSVYLAFLFTQGETGDIRIAFRCADTYGDNESLHAPRRLFQALFGAKSQGWKP